MHSGLVRALAPVSLCLGLGIPAVGSHQRTNPIVVVGRVTTGNAQPLASAQIAVLNTTLGALSDNDGRYRVIVPLASTKNREITLIARRIGYSPVTRTIQPSTDTVTVDFALTPSVMQLSDVVVTGAAVEHQRAKVGNAVASVDAQRAAAPAPVPAVSRKLSKDERTNGNRRDSDPAFNTEGYDAISENPFLSHRDDATLDVLDRRRSCVVQQRQALPHGRAAPATRRGSPRGAHQLLPVRAARSAR